MSLDKKGIEPWRIALFPSFEEGVANQFELGGELKID